MINVLVVDDQNLTHRLIETYLKPEPEIEIVGFASNGQDAIEQIPNLQPDVVLMDLEMPQMDGLTATKIITQKFIATKVLILTVHDNEQHLGTALENGAKGYLLKTTTAQELKNAIYYANQGYFQLSVELTEKYLKKILSSRPQSREIVDLKRKIGYLYKSLTRLEEQLDKFPEQDLKRHVRDLLKKGMLSFSDRDSHLQYKVDRIKHNQDRLKQNVKYLFSMQLLGIVLSLIAIGAVAYSFLK